VDRIPSRADLALAVAVGVVSMQSAWGDAGLKSPAWAVIALIQLTALPLAVRRARPVAVFGVTLAAAVAGLLAFDGFQALGPAIALHAVARHRDRTTSLGALAVALTASIIPAVATGADSPLFAAIVALLFGAAWIVGRRGARRVAEVAEAEARTARAVEIERARIARELHDVISHNVSVMVVQAAAGRDVFAADPARALGALEAIESVGRDALGELRALLDVTRRGDASESGRPPAPQPGLGRLEALADGVRASGVSVELEVEGAIEGLPAAVDVSAYRIVQEALTNVLKHANASAAGVAVRRSRTQLEVDITDDGTGSAPVASDGRGLVGMRERARLLGGELTAGARPAGGFAVRARIPLAREPR
jgi:signal transduction histidine kinase